MSDTSLYAGLYKYTRNLAELVDSVLVEMKTKPASPVSPERQRLGGMLLEANMNQGSDLTSRMLALMLWDIPGTVTIDWQEVGQALLSDKVNDNAVRNLESLARLLEKQQLKAASRTWG